MLNWFEKRTGASAQVVACFPQAKLQAIVYRILQFVYSTARWTIRKPRVKRPYKNTSYF
jgi:hypothetical protein